MIVTNKSFHFLNQNLNFHLVLSMENLMVDISSEMSNNESKK